MLRIALTGGIACGKSVAGKMLSNLGFDVIEADEIAKDLMQPGTEVTRDIKRDFGLNVFASDGSVDRKALGFEVMRDAERRAALNSIVHPPVIARWNKWLEERQEGLEAAVVIVPLLYESGQGEGWDAVICLHSDRAMQVARLADRGIPAEEAAKWLAAQMKLSEKMKLADYVICNNGSMDMLRKQLEEVVKTILEK